MVNGFRTHGPRKQKLLTHMQALLLYINGRHVNPAHVMRLLGIPRKTEKMRTKEISGHIGALKVFIAENMVG